MSEENITSGRDTNITNIDQVGGDYVAGDKTIHGDVVGGDKITAGDIQGSIVAMGEGAQVIYNNVERALTSVEVEDQYDQREQRLLADGITTYVHRMQQQAGQAEEQPTVGSPYKALLEYDIADAALFYGRSDAIRSIRTQIERDQLTVLHAESGAGKTSLVKAGLIPRLLADGSLPLYVRPYDIPAHFAIKRALLPNLTDVPMLAIDTLHDFLVRVTDLLGGQRVVVILDQFEEVFTQQMAEERLDFIEQLGICLDDDLLPVRWIFSMRSEWFGQLGTFRPHVRNPYQNEYFLRRLNPDEAREIIVAPAERFGVTYADGLVDAIISDLKDEDGEVNPPQLQLVCSTLFDSKPPNSKKITAALYGELGGTSGILRSHLDRVLSRQFSGPDRGIARRMLEALISSDQRRIVRAQSKLFAELQPLGVDDNMFDSVLIKLLESRLLRAQEIQEDEDSPVETGYELAHDYLLDKVELDPEAQARKAAQELLEQEVENHKRYKTHISPDKLLLIEAQEENLIIDEEAAELLEHSKRLISRQRASVFAGAGVIVAMIALAIFSGITAVTANQIADEAELEAEAAEAQSRQAAFQQEVAEDAAAAAAADQEAAREAALEAAALADEAEELAGEAQSRLDRINAQLTEQFLQTGQVQTAPGPVDVLWDGEFLWVPALNGNQIEQIDPIRGAVVGRIETGTQPSYLIEFDGYLWVVNRGDDTVQKIDKETDEIIATIQTDDDPRIMRTDGETLWIVNTSAGTIQQIDPTSERVINTLEVGSTPTDMAWDGTSWWVSLGAENQIVQVDPDPLRVIDAISVGDFPQALLWNGSSLWVANLGSNDVQQIDTFTKEIAETIDVGRGPRALEWDGFSLWVALGDESSIQQIAPVSRRVVATYAVGNGPGALAYTGSQMWVANFFSNNVELLDPSSGAIARTIGINYGPEDLLWDGEGLWVTNLADNTIQQIEIQTGQIIRTLDVASGPTSIALGDAGTYWVTSSYGRKLEQLDPNLGVIAQFNMPTGPRDVLWDGEFVWVAFDSENVVRKLNPITGTVLAEIATDSVPYRLVFDGTYIWVMNRRGNSLQQIERNADRIIARVEVDREPLSMILDDDGYLWVTSNIDNTIVRVGTRSRQVEERINVLNEPRGLVWDGDHLWIMSRSENAIQWYDPENGFLSAAIGVGQAPNAITFDGSSVWIALEADHAIQEIRQETLELLGLGEPDVTHDDDDE